MDLILDIISWGFILTGSFFTLVGAFGVLRLPDFYTRMHAAGIVDTFGLDLLCVGMIIQAGLSLVSIKLVFILIFVFFTSPTSTYAIANAAWRSGLKPFVIKTKDTDETGGTDQ